MTTKAHPVDLRVLEPSLTQPLFGFYTAICSDKYFRPHPFTLEHAKAVCENPGKDIYVAAVRAASVVGYGMLRGWNDGYAVPSLGIALLPTERGKGLGRILMSYLHYLAKSAGAVRIRLKVYPANETALALYRSFGYVFDNEQQDNQYVGYCDL
jgi:ribosomal protein S18 acetylase RimI-like enzyme